MVARLVIQCSLCVHRLCKYSLDVPVFTLVLIYFRFDGENDGDNDDSHDNDGDNDVEDVISMTADRRHKKRASSTAPAATNTIGVHAKKSEKPLENTGRRTKTSRLPSTNIVPAIVPRGSIMSEQKSSVRQQESTPSIRTTSLAKAGKLTLNGPKRRRLEIDTTSGAVQEAAMPESPVPCRPKMSIDANKQDQTTLWISLPSSTDAVPLMLRSCMTMTSLFDSVFKIWGLAEQQQQDKILGLRTTLGWTQSDGVRKRLMLKREFEDSFETFLRIIDASLCWEQEGGCCSVDIEAVMA